MRMAGKLKVYGMMRYVIGKVRLVGEQDSRFIARNFLQRGVQIGGPSHYVAHAA